VSLQGRAATRGSTITIYRPVEAETGDLGRKVASWTTVESGLKGLISNESDELMQKVFGTTQVLKDRLYLPGAHDLRVGDAVKVTAGKRLSEKWRVMAVLHLDHAGRVHKEAALESTTETIP
jgi:hypothetical protein